MDCIRISAAVATALAIGIAGCVESQSDATATVTGSNYVEGYGVWFAPNGSGVLSITSEAPDLGDWHATSDDPSVVSVVAAELGDGDWGEWLPLDLEAHAVGDTHIRVYDGDGALVTAIRAQVRNPDDLALIQSCDDLACTVGSTIRVLEGESPQFPVSYFVDVGAETLYVPGHDLLEVTRGAEAGVRSGRAYNYDFAVIPAPETGSYPIALAAPPAATFAGEVRAVAFADASLTIRDHAGTLDDGSLTFLSASIAGPEGEPVFFDRCLWSIGDTIFDRDDPMFVYRIDSSAEPTEVTCTVGELSATVQVRMAR